ncbi:SPW repeat protein [Rhizobium leguminosarum]|uniref:SPW repeat domain-containing protein n=1 Tax=Rhizobium leguminosarum TaxID=384 RepID=UPI003F9E2DEF
MNRYRWQDVIAALMGIYVIVAPWLISMQFPGPTASRLIYVAHFVEGFVITAIACRAIVVSKTWFEWLLALLGAWLIASPWALAFNTMIALTYSSIVAGLVLLVLAGSALMAQRRPPSSSW